MQIKVFYLALLPAALSATIPAPIKARQLVSDIKKPSDLTGINWSYAEKECDFDQRGDLFAAFKHVVELAHAAYPPPVDIRENVSFKDFFGSGYEEINNQLKFEKIFENLMKAGQFPVYGNGRDDEANKLNVRCTKSYSPECPKKVLAYTRSNNMVFCPAFWNGMRPYGQRFPHLVDRVKGKPTQALAKLMTMEHIVLHELMHLDIAAYDEHILDVKTDIPGETQVPIYGVMRSKKLALKKGENKPNFQTLKNADSYAWFATSYYFSKAWGMTVDMPEGYVEGSVTGNPTIPPNQGLQYGDYLFGDTEWTSV